MIYDWCRVTYYIVYRRRNERHFTFVYFELSELGKHLQNIREKMSALFWHFNEITDAQLRTFYKKFLPEMRPMFTISNQLWIEWSVKQPFTFLGYFCTAVFVSTPLYTYTHVWYILLIWIMVTYFDIHTFQHIRELLHNYRVYEMCYYTRFCYSLMHITLAV